MKLIPMLAIESLSDLILEEFGPLSFSPRARNFIRDQAVPEDGRRYVNAILSGELDWRRYQAMVKGQLQSLTY